MKLLNKQQVNTAKALDRQREINEGSKLAAKVDVLRETFSVEQANLMKFRDETLKKVKQELADLIAEKGELQKSIEGLEDRRKVLLIPLDAEWKKVEEVQKVIVNSRSKIVQDELHLKEVERDLKLRIKEIEFEEGRIADMRLEVSNNLAQAEKAREEAEDTLKTAREDQASITKELDERDTLITSKENDVGYRERDLKNAFKVLEGKKQELLTKELQLKDREETLEREIKRQKHG